MALHLTIERGTFRHTVRLQGTCQNIFPQIGSKKLARFYGEEIIQIDEVIGEFHNGAWKVIGASHRLSFAKVIDAIIDRQLKQDRAIQLEVEMRARKEREENLAQEAAKILEKKQK